MDEKPVEQSQMTNETLIANLSAHAEYFRKMFDGIKQDRLELATLIRNEVRSGIKNELDAATDSFKLINVKTGYGKAVLIGIVLAGGIAGALIMRVSESVK